MHGNDHGWGRDLARRLGIGGIVERLNTREGATLHIRCAGKSGEGHVLDVKIRPNDDPNGVAKQMINAGWTLGRRKIYCPDCGRRTKPAKAAKRRDRQATVAEMPLPMIPPEVTPAPPAPPRTRSQAAKERWQAMTPEQRSEMGQKMNKARWGRRRQETLQQEETRLRHEGRIPAAPCPTLKETKPMATQEQAAAPTATEQARAAKRAVMQWLDEAFNVEKGTFQAGVSDATIAKETGVAEAKVKALREEFYGPLGEPDEMRELKEALAAANKALGVAREAWAVEAARIGRRFEVLCIKMGWPVA